MINHHIRSLEIQISNIMGRIDTIDRAIAALDTPDNPHARIDRIGLGRLRDEQGGKLHRCQIHLKYDRRAAAARQAKGQS